MGNSADCAKRCIHFTGKYFTRCPKHIPVSGWPSDCGLYTPKEETVMSETYEISIVCHNCGYKPCEGISEQNRIRKPKRFSVPKGTEVKKFLMDMVCENCGCDGFMGIL